MRIKEAIKDKITGEWGDVDEVGLGVHVLRTTNFTNTGRISFEKVVKRNISDSLIERKKLLPGDIIIEKSGGSPNQPVGRVVFFNNNEDLFLCNNFTAILRPSERLVPKYFFYDLFYKYLSQVTLKYQNKTTGIINLQLDRYLDEKINVPSFDKQKQIVQILDTADTLRQKRKEQLNLLDDYLKSVFFEMFGDPLRNEKKFDVVPIRETVVDVKYGTSKKANIKKGQFPILRMSNITYSGEWDFTNLKYIDLETNEAGKYTVKKGDLLFNRTNSKELVGKTAVFNSDQVMAYAGYLIRCRFDKKKANPIFVSYFLNSSYGKSKLSHMCKNIVGMANINAQELQEINIILPPIELQNKFVSIVEQVEQTKQKMRASLDEMDNHFNALMQRYFG